MTWLEQFCATVYVTAGALFCALSPGVFVALCVALCVALALCCWRFLLALPLLLTTLHATPPAPAGTRLSWEPPPGLSNATFYVWRQLVDSRAWDSVGLSTSNSFTIPVATADGTLYGVTVLGLTNGAWRFHHLGIAGWWPDSTNGGTLRLIGPVNVRLLQAADSPAGPWSDVAVITNAPVSLSAAQKQFFRTQRVYLPPPLP